MFSVSGVWFRPVSAGVWPTFRYSPGSFPSFAATDAAQLPIVSVPHVGFESITRSSNPVTPVRRGGVDRLSRTGQIRRDTAEPRQESAAIAAQTRCAK